MKPSGCNIIHISDSGPYMGQTNEMVHRKSRNCPWVQNFLAKVCLRVHCATMQIDLVTTLTLNKICSASLSIFRQLWMIYWYWIVKGFNVKGLNIWRLYSAVWHFDPENAQKLKILPKRSKLLWSAKKGKKISTILLCNHWEPLELCVYPRWANDNFRTWRGDWS